MQRGHSVALYKSVESLLAIVIVMTIKQSKWKVSTKCELSTFTPHQKFFEFNMRILIEEGINLTQAVVTQGMIFRACKESSAYNPE